LFARRFFFDYASAEILPTPSPTQQIQHKHYLVSPFKDDELGMERDKLYPCSSARLASGTRTLHERLLQNEAVAKWNQSINMQEDIDGDFA
jgi:hypothetical protein